MSETAQQRPADAPAADGPVADAAERWGWRVLGWRAAHPGASRAIAIAQLVAAAVATVSFALVAVVDEPFRQAFAQALLLLVPVGVVLLVTRSRGIDWRFALRWLLVSALAAPCIGVVSWGVTAAAGVTALDDGGTVAVAAIVEEVGKLVPFALLALVATNRVRRFTVTDYLVVGWLSGMGFSLVEESLRLTAIHSSTGLAMLDALMGDADPSLVVSPLLTNYGGDGSPIHPVWSALVLGSLGVGVAIARRSDRLRWLRWLLPAIALGAAILDHAMGNSGTDAIAILTGKADLLAKVLAVPWLLTAQGMLLHVAAVVLWLVAAMLDADRRAIHGSVQPATLSRMARISQGGWWRRPAAAAAGAGLQVVDDAIGWARGMRVAVGQGRRVAVSLVPLAHHANAMARAEAAALPPLDRRGMRRLHLRILLVLVVGVLVALLLAWLLAASIGVAFTGPLSDTNFWLLGILEALSDWWNGLPPLAQAAIIVGGLALFGFAGMTALGALTAMGWVTFGLTYGGPLARALRDPSRVRDYLRETPRRQILADLVELVLASPIGFRSPALARLLTRRIDDLTVKEADEIITAIVDTTRLMGAGHLAEGFVQLLEDLRYGLEHPQPMWPAPGWQEPLTGR